MTTEEKRSRMIAMCSSSQNGCDRCRLRSSCRKSGHPPVYMKDETVELVFNDRDCSSDVCPISESCDACSNHSPMKASDEEIKAIFADLIRRGGFKEE